MSKVTGALRIYRDEGLTSVMFVILNRITGSVSWIVRSALMVPLSYFYSLRPIDQYCFQQSIRRLNYRTDNEGDLDDVLQTAYEYTGLGFYRSISPIQHPDELAELAEEVGAVEPSTILEIGTGLGGTLYVWSRYTDADIIIGIDTNFSELEFPSLRYPDRTKFLSEFSSSAKMYFVEKNSQKEETLRRITEITGGEGVDFLFIDGDHSYEGVRRDFELYEGIVNEDGLISFHDIRNSNTGVPQFWGEIGAENEKKEIYYKSDFKYNSYFSKRREERLRSLGGIGLLYT